ncbi:MAG: protein-tyrosine-phosphatase [Cytophagales bacterium CG12_big_fil_rev_8_21_14_0_65_40_12]|nr:MAG: protein-tyrosine-phosphatase [Cytophagales bacterium CG12_big_fil_rev_8_21_14_0_65_40_12]PIW04614.1 MAG: protein-tyrosine-phosphatase [Cytophagales bacterium CG17_big_fil_post_rev_8_21_14_2_50_40_13]
MPKNFYPNLDAFIKDLKVEQIKEERFPQLQAMVDFVQNKLDNELPIQLNFICTHNSRRSQLAQIWAQTISAYFGIETSCFSGGVEVTAFNENAVNAIKAAGFKIESTGNTNPIYEVSYSDSSPNIKAFSKKFDDAPNPNSGFAAIMTCSHADENCPFIPGAEIRIPLRYDDPKAFDGTDLMEAKYLERSKEIATEMLYVFSRIKK